MTSTAKNKKPASERITIARCAGFCGGVAIAVKSAEKLLAENEVFCIGDIIHNSFVIEALKNRGLKIVSGVEDIPGRAHVIIRAHGLPSGEIARLRKKRCVIHDLTCPILKKIHTNIKKLKRQGYKIAIVGNPAHAEVEAFVSRSGEGVSVISEIRDSANLPYVSKRAVICQSTISSGLFVEMAAKTLGKSLETLVIDTICGEAKKRRKEANALAKKSKMVIIVGDRKSSNTMTLAGVVGKHCSVTLISSADEIKKNKIRYPLAIVSGASSPRELVLDIARKVC
ncbi:MAG: 4-hydroxy-3-methylbut-2-enyl diphosphate reductase [Elusimicrobiota bacterium]|nr:4-hydroxy-3-methylbut-2-enyl diphosphate reductase [Elusimicrobiota bacterium]